MTCLAGRSGRFPAVVAAAGLLAGGLAVGGGVTAVPAAAAGFSIDATSDGPDTTPGDGLCGDGTAGTCTLRAAIAEANATPGPDTITLTAATHTLSMPGADEEANLTGDLDITDSLTITGNGATIDAAGLDRALDVIAGTTTISGLTITGGNAPTGAARPGYGGALAVNAGATAHLASVNATGNTAAELGGALGARNGAHLDITDSTLTANTAPFGGAIGATFAASIATTRTTIATNTSTHSGGGIFTIGPTTIVSSTVNANTAGTGWGGGISTILAGPLTVTDTAITDNTATIAGGTLSLAAPTTITRSSVTDNTAGLAGGIGNAYSPLTLETTTISTNDAASGAGLYATGDPEHPATITVADTTITANTGSGAGLQTGTDTTTTLHNSIVADQATAADCAGDLAPTSDGHNLDSDGTCALAQPTDLPATDPVLGPLTSTGARESHTPQTGSPAIDTGAGCDPLDQRHTARPQHGACDRGAVEARTTYLPFGGAQNFLGTNTQLGSPWRENASLAIAGTCVSKEQGELVMAVSDWNYAGSSNGGGGFQNCVPGQGGTIANVHHDPDGYTYVIEMPENYLGTGDLRIQGEGLAHCAGVSVESGNGGDTGSNRHDTEVTVRADDGTDGPASGTAVFGPQTITSTTSVGGTVNYYCGATNNATRWRTLATIPGAAAGDRFFLQIRSLPGTSTTTTTGSNQFALRANTGASFSPCTTDSAMAGATSQCPTIYAESDLGLYANLGSGQSVFRAAAVDARYSGQLLDLYLWDVGEGASTVEVLDPNGSSASFRYEVACKDGTFVSETGTACEGEVAPQGGYGPFDGVTRFNVANSYCANRPSTRVISCSKFNDRLLRLTVELPENITAAYGGRTWWKVRYTAGGSITDRTTWKVAVRELGAAG